MEIKMENEKYCDQSSNVMNQQQGFNYFSPSSSYLPYMNYGYNNQYYYGNYGSVGSNPHSSYPISPYVSSTSSYSPYLTPSTPYYYPESPQTDYNFNKSQSTPFGYAKSTDSTSSPVVHRNQNSYVDYSFSDDSAYQTSEVSSDSLSMPATSNESNKKRKRECDDWDKENLNGSSSINQDSKDISKRPKVIKLIINKSNNSTNDTLKCEICLLQFSSAAKLLMHQHRYHKNGSSTQCPICYKKFGNQANTLVHLRAHTQEKTFKCKMCDSAFCDSSTLKKHLRTHTGEKPYACHLCDKKFTQSGNLKRHILVHEKYDPIQMKQSIQDQHQVSQSDEFFNSLNLSYNYDQSINSSTYNHYQPYNFTGNSQPLYDYQLHQ